MEHFVPGPQGAILESRHEAKWQWLIPVLWEGVRALQNLIEKECVGPGGVGIRSKASGELLEEGNACRDLVWRVGEKIGGGHCSILMDDHKCEGIWEYCSFGTES